MLLFIKKCFHNNITEKVVIFVNIVDFNIVLYFKGKSP